MTMYAEKAMSIPSVLVRIVAQKESPEATARPPIKIVPGLTRKLLTRRKRSGQRTVLSASGIGSMPYASIAPEWGGVTMGSVGSILCVAPFGISKYQYGWSSTPGFPVELDGAGQIHALFLTERRTRYLVWRNVQEIRVGDGHRPIFLCCSSFTAVDKVRMATCQPGIDFPQIVFRVGEIAGIGVPRVRLWFDQKRNPPGRELLMH